MMYKLSTFTSLLAGLAVSSADIYMVNFANKNDDVEMVTVFSSECIPTGENSFAKYHCDEGQGSLAVAYYQDSSCSVILDSLKSTLLYTDEWYAAYTDQVRGVSYSKSAKLYCDAQAMSESNRDMAWKSQGNGGVVMHYFSNGDEEMTCATEPTVSQYVIQDSCVQYAASSGIVVSRSSDGQTELSEHLVEHSRSNGRRSLINGERIFAVFNAGSQSKTISADFFSNGFCVDDEIVQVGDDDGEDMGSPALRGKAMQKSQRQLQTVSLPVEKTNKELYSLEMLAGSCSNRNMFLLTGIFTEHHVLAAHVTALKIDQLTNEAFNPYYASSWTNGIGSSVVGFLMLGVVIGVGIAMVLYKYGVVSVQVTSPEEYGKLGMDSTHSVANSVSSPMQFRGLMTESPPQSPEDNVEMSGYGGLPDDSEAHSTTDMMHGYGKADDSKRSDKLELESSKTENLEMAAQDTTAAPEPVASGSADSSDEMLPNRARFTAKVLQ